MSLSLNSFVLPRHEEQEDEDKKKKGKKSRDFCERQEKLSFVFVVRSFVACSSSFHSNTSRLQREGRRFSLFSRKYFLLYNVPSLQKVFFLSFSLSLSLSFFLSFFLFSFSRLGNVFSALVFIPDSCLLGSLTIKTGTAILLP